jgi:hypothetical protein
VRSVGSSSFVLTTRHGDVTVTVTDGTKYLETTKAAVADATVGSFVRVAGARDDSDDDATITARHIGIVPAPPGDDDGGRGRHSVHGTVLSNDGSTLVVDAGDDGEVTVLTDADTTVSKTTVAAFSDVAAGERAKVAGTRQDDGTFAARKVHLFDPAPTAVATPASAATFQAAAAPAVTPAAVAPAAVTTDDTATAAAADDQHDAGEVEGEITSVSDPTFTIKTRNGSSIVVSTSSGTEITGPDGMHETFADLHVGDRVRVEGTRTGDSSIAADEVHEDRCDGDGGHDGDRDASFDRSGPGDGSSFDGARTDDRRFDDGGHDGRR